MSRSSKSGSRRRSPRAIAVLSCVIEPSKYSAVAFILLIHTQQGGRKDASARTSAYGDGRYGSNLLKRHGVCRIHLGRGQGKQEARAMVQLALCANRSAVRQNNMLRDGKPQPCPAGLSRASLIHTVETLEKARQMFGRNARPKVSDVEFDAIRNRASSENHFFPRRRILQRVLNQVRKDL